MRFIGIDPGLATVGIGTLLRKSNGEIVEPDWLTIRTKAGLPLAERVYEIAEDLQSFISTFQPDMAIVEKLFFATNERTAIDVAHARGVILSCLCAKGIPILEPTPLQLKHAITGDGRADKQQVQAMLPKLLPITEIPRPDDAADALALALYGSIHAGPANTRGIIV